MVGWEEMSHADDSARGSGRELGSILAHFPSFNSHYPIEKRPAVAAEKGQGQMKRGG